MAIESALDSAISEISLYRRDGWPRIADSGLLFSQSSIWIEGSPSGPSRRTGGNKEKNVNKKERPCAGSQYDRP